MQGFSLLLEPGFGIALAIVATNLRASELEFLRTVTRSLLTFAIVPMLWILIQILPFGIFDSSDLEQRRICSRSDERGAYKR